METNSNLRSILNRLIQTCKDGQEGYLTAAENVGDDEVKSLFNKYSLQRVKYVGELQSLAHELGDSDPEDASSVPGAIHRGWINLRSAVVNGEAHAILRECERGESSAVEEYEKVLKLELPANIREILSQHYATILETHDRVRTLADDASPNWV